MTYIFTQSGIIAVEGGAAAYAALRSMSLGAADDMARLWELHSDTESVFGAILYGGRLCLADLIFAILNLIRRK